MCSRAAIVVIGTLLLIPSGVASPEDNSQPSSSAPLLAPGQAQPSADQSQSPPAPLFGSGSAPQSQAGADFFKALMEAQQKQQAQPTQSDEERQAAGQEALKRLFEGLKAQQTQPPQQPTPAGTSPPAPVAPVENEAARIQMLRMKLGSLRFGPEATVEERQEADRVFEGLLAIQNLEEQRNLVTEFLDKEQAAYEPNLPPPRLLNRPPEPPEPALWQGEQESLPELDDVLPEGEGQASIP